MIPYSIDEYYKDIKILADRINIYSDEVKSEHLKWSPDLIISIARGGCVPGVYLSHRIKTPHEVLDIRLRDHTAKPNLTVLEKAFAYQKKILIIDDINDTGDTFNYIVENFGKHEERVKFAALINNKPSKAKVDYHGYEIDKSKNPAWIVFPWEEWEK